jgi:UDP-glucose 4-epimerase
VTGSSGHLGEGVVRTLQERQYEVLGLDLVDSPFTTHVGSICDPSIVRECMPGTDFVIHTAALHKPHIATHPRQAFVDTNISGTLNLLEAASESDVSGFVFSSTTSVFGAALRPAESEPAVWVNEDLDPAPRNIYGVTKRAAEEVCELFARSNRLPCVVLRIARFFPDTDDGADVRIQYEDLNVKAYEYLYRRLDLADAVEAHVLAAERSAEIGFQRYVLSATSPFASQHLSRLRTDAPDVVRSLFPDYEDVYVEHAWTMFPSIDRVYVNNRARSDLGWTPRINFRHVLDSLKSGDSFYSPLALAVGSKMYHSEAFEEGPYPVEEAP